MTPKLNDSPWGPPDYQREIAPGIVHLTTPRHGGFALSDERWAEVRAKLPEFRPFAGDYWLEEDCDWCVAVLCFPEAFAVPDCFYARESAKAHTQACVREFPLPALLVEKADRYAAAVVGKWRACGCGGDSSGWSLIVSRGGECRTVFCGNQHPRETWYSDAELAAIERPKPAPEVRASRARRNEPDDFEYSGAFDGVTVTSDADPGL